MTDPTPISDEELSAMQARCDAATAAPWWVELAKADYAGVRVPLIRYRWDDVPTWLAEGSVHENNERNFDFIARSRSDMPRLIAEVIRLRAAEKELREALQRIASEDYDDIEGSFTRSASEIARAALARETEKQNG